MLAALQVRLLRILQRSSFEKIRRRRATDSVRAGARDHTTDDIAPAGKELEHCTRTLAQQHSGAEVCSERGDELGCSAQTSLPSADIHDSRSHQYLKRREDWHV